MELWELVVREQIRETVAAYAHHADTGRFDDLAALFVDDGVLETDEQQWRGRAAIRVFLAGTGSALAEATTRPLIRHHVSNLRITVASPDEATGSAYFFVVTERGPDHWGRYRDVYACAGDRWLFRHRRVRLDGYAPNSWVAERRRGGAS